MEFNFESHPSSHLNPQIRIVEQNPLQIPQIIAKVFEFLDAESLKACRLVCQIWSQEGRRELLKNDSIFIRTPPAFHSELRSVERQKSLKSALTNFISYSSSLDPLNLRINNYEDIQLFAQTPTLFNKVTCLDYNIQNLPPQVSQEAFSPMEHLFGLVQQLCSLKILETSYLNLSPHQSWLQTEPNPEDDNDVKLTSLVDKLAVLRELKLNFWLHQSTLRNLVNYRDHLAIIDTLQVNSEQVFNLFADEIGVTWRIRRLRLMINNEIPMEVIRRFLRRLSPTLHHLRLSFFVRRRDGNEIDPFESWAMVDPFCGSTPIPWSLTNLKTLDVYEDDSQLEGTVWKSVGVGLQLSHLRKLVIRSSITSQFDEMMCQWVRSRNRPMRSFSLRELVIWPKVMSSPTILFAKCWPNLQSLSIKLEINFVATVASFFAIFSDLCRLQRLELFLTDDHGVGRHVSKLNFDELLTGCKRPAEYEGGCALNPGQLEQVRFRSITNMQCLKCFKMECITCCQLHGWTDFFIYHGLFYLKSLQSLEVTKKFITDKAIEELREKLGETVHIFFYTDRQVVMNAHGIFL